ncbi:MAG: NADH:flavin oxidoreductase, partial [Clostridiales Family XIII bacterium]|nr:NADH:flavin oxidoreductase [Clostridiales Family XIII bacterium]
MDHARLLSPLTIGAITVKNRIVMPAFNLSYTPDGRIDERVIAFYEARAEGGAGMLVVGGCAVQAVGRGRNMIGVYDDGFSEGLSRLTARLKARGATVICQLFHGGAYAKGADGDSVAPSAVYSNYSKQTPRALSAGEVDAVLRDFASAAFRAKEAGFDGVELIGSAGYLLSQFLSPLKNKRDDAYAWQEKESPFAEALIRGIKARCGSEYPVVVRISGNEFVEGGRGSAGAIAAARVSEAAGADALSVTGGWHESRVPQITAHLPEAGYAYLAREVKQAVRLPIFAANRIDDPYVAEDLLASGSAD